MAAAMYRFDPHCFICGVVIGAKVDNNLPWGQQDLPCYGGHQIKVDDLWWCNLFRSLMVSAEEDGARPYVTGVGCYLHAAGDEVTVPRRYHAKWDDVPKPEVINFIPVHFFDNAGGFEDIDGYLFHDFCWEKLNDRVGRIPTAQLEPLAHVLRMRSNNEDYGGARQFLDYTWRGGDRELVNSVGFVMDPMAIREVARLLQNIPKLGAEEFRPAGEQNGAIQCLPQDLRMMVMDRLSSRDVRSACEAFGWTFRNSFWMSRFPRKLLFEMQPWIKANVDWWEFWHCLNDLIRHKISPGLWNRVRILKIIETLARDFGSYKSLYRPIDETIPDDAWTVTFLSSRALPWLNSVHSASVGHDLNMIRFTFVNDEYEEWLLSGMTFYPCGATIGKCVINEYEAKYINIPVKSRLVGLKVKLDRFGVRDIKIECENRSETRWVVDFEGLSDHEVATGILFDGEETLEREICGSMGINSFTSIGCNLDGELNSTCNSGVCGETNDQECLRRLHMWRPDIPPVHYNLNEDQYTENLHPETWIGESLPTRQMPFRPLRYIIFGGEDGQDLRFLKGIRGYRPVNIGPYAPEYAPCGLEFFYSDRPSLLWGVRAPVVSEMAMRGDLGEFMEVIQFSDCASRQAGTGPAQLKMWTNRGCEIETGQRPSLPRRTSKMRARHGERIVGFYSGPGVFLAEKVSGGPRPWVSDEGFTEFGIITVKVTGCEQGLDMTPWHKVAAWPHTELPTPQHTLIKYVDKLD
ncbi:MAG: hypothetical protein M4579_002092 [Chaenotheca gracillima]|nr:MAG: hypothetical protein M4579_002092 [Chaenotheca gracillima]